MAIDIKVAIRRREREIEDLKELQAELILLVADAQQVEQGQGSNISDVEFKRRLNAATDTANRLGLALDIGPVSTWRVW